MNTNIPVVASSLLPHTDEDQLPPRPLQICDNCWRRPFAAHFGILRDCATPWLYPSYLYQTSVLQLEQGAAAGCMWCAAVGRYVTGNAATGTLPRDLEFEVELIGGGPPKGGNPPKTQTLQIGYRGIRRSGMWVAHTAEDDPAAPYVVARNLILDVGSPRALSLARSLIDECVGRHAECSRISPASDTPLPSRLIDCTDIAHPRLASTEGQYGRYLALSYVWGEAQPHRTTKANIVAYLDGLNPVHLPQTIRDAIHVTHALGVQYLWIDSLCIVQDSAADKLRELTQMHLIYRHAYVTIVAASAKRVSEGFLQRRAARLPELSLPFVCPREHPGEQQRAGTVHLSPITDSLPAVSDPITTRGWCFQEYFMSPRKLVFTSETLEFHCRTTGQNIGGAFHPGTPWGERLPNELFHTDVDPPEQDSREWHALHRTWWRKVEEYTKCDIGEASDKLVACSSIAEVFAPLIGGDYLAGLWRSTPVNGSWRPENLRDLMWTREPRRTGSKPARPRVYVAPSWSWASVAGQVTLGGNWLELWFASSPPTSVARVVGDGIQLKNPELRFGQVTGGYLVMHAMLISPSRVLRDLNHHMSIDDPADESLADDDAHTWFVPVFRSQERIYGLVITRVDTDSLESRDSAAATYRRIGVYEHHSEYALHGQHHVKVVLV